MLPRCLIVDGHSVIFQVDALRAAHERRTASARDQLVNTLQRYNENTGIHVVLVFDGKGTRTEQSSPSPGLQVFYSKRGQTADAVIERIAAKYGQTMDLTVATDDHLERTTVMALGAHPISVLQLVTEINQAEDDLQQRLKKIRRKR